MICRSCGGDSLASAIGLGDQYLSDFRADNDTPARYPLNVVFCTDCFLAQLDTTVPRELLYHDRYGFKSSVNGTIRANHADTVKTALRHKPGAQTWLDIASNDGTLLSMIPQGIVRVGCDPVTKYCREAEQHADLIVNDYFDPGHFNHGFDVVTSISMFYDIDRLDEFVSGVKLVLNKRGVWVVQQNSLLQTLRLNAVDNICHEHITYFSLLALRSLLDRHDLEVFHVDEQPVNGGSFRTLIGHRDVFRLDESVRSMLRVERGYQLDSPSAFTGFRVRVNERLERLHRLIVDLNRDGKTVYIYGASTRGGTLWQAAQLGRAMLPFAVDRNPEKVGLRVASIGVPIISEQQARRDQPDYMLVSPWFFRDEFVARERDYLDRGGKLIFPLPDLEIVGR